MAETASDFLIKRINEWGLTRIYGYPGDGINGIMGALDRANGAVKYVQVRHEEMAAFMACAHAKFTGEVGICLATSGPGAIHLLNGLYDAKMDHASVVAIVGQQARAAIGGDYQQEVDLVTLFKDVAHEYVHMASTPAAIRHLIDRAIRIAKAERTVTCIIIPNDVQEMSAVEAPPRKHGTIHSGVGYAPPRVIPKDIDLRRAAEVLNAGEKVAMLVGAGALQATDEVIEVADILGAGVAKALLGKARGVQIDIDAKMVSVRYPMEVNLVGDSAETLRALMPLLKRKDDRQWRKQIEDGVAEWWKLLEARAMNEAKPINPQRVFWELSPRLPDNCIIVADSGSAANWFARDLKVRRGMMASLSGNLATMGPGVPYAISAKFAFPDRVVIATVGDGAMLMNGINEVVTIANYWKEWSDPRLIILVLANRDLNQVTWEQRVMAGDPKYECSQNVPPFEFARYAEMLGLTGIRVDKPEQIGSAWEQALSATRPVILEAITDPEVPTLPPHITFEEAKKFIESMSEGDPHLGHMIKQTFKEAVQGILPHKK